MPELQVTSWRDLPSLVVVREGDDVVKVPLPPRFQEAIDEAAMRLGETDSAAYLDGWTRSEWLPVEGPVDQAADRVARDLEAQWNEDDVTGYLDRLGPAGTDAP